MNGSSEETLAPLELRARDYVTSAAKAVLGAVPFAGSLLIEVAGTIIPNQRVDRIAKFASKLEEKISRLQQDVVRTYLSDENFTDLLEESIRQAARSVTDERRVYIASLVAHGISADSVEFIESKHLLRILGELNDFEVLWLRYYLDRSFRGANDQVFRMKHADVFEITPLYLRCPEEVVYQNALKDSYMQHLAQLGLIAPRYSQSHDDEVLKLSPGSGELEATGYNLTILGKVLLRHIGFIPEHLDKQQTGI
jgi:outer membrane murein-binding lipoprotein Lpp